MLLTKQRRNVILLKQPNLLYGVQINVAALVKSQYNFLYNIFNTDYLLSFLPI